VYEKKGGWGPWFLHFISPVEQGMLCQLAV
jgi:hypothetical protein